MAEVAGVADDGIRTGCHQFFLFFAAEEDGVASFERAHGQELKHDTYRKEDNAGPGDDAVSWDGADESGVFPGRDNKCRPHDEGGKYKYNCLSAVIAGDLSWFTSQDNDEHPGGPEDQISCAQWFSHELHSAGEIIYQAAGDY